MDWDSFNFSTIEICAMIPTMLGAYLVSQNRGDSWGFYGHVLFLVSNTLWIIFAILHGHAGLLITNGYFLYTSVSGIYRYSRNLNDSSLEAATSASSRGCCLSKGDSNERLCKTRALCSSRNM